MTAAGGPQCRCGERIGGRPGVGGGTLRCGKCGYGWVGIEDGGGMLYPEVLLSARRALAKYEDDREWLQEVLAHGVVC